MQIKTNPEGDVLSLIRPTNGQRNIAYFSMEIGIDSRIPSYSGGLGILAGDTIKSFADLKVAAVAVTLLYKKGHFHQELAGDGTQKELPCEWNPSEFLELLPDEVCLIICGRRVCIRAWTLEVVGINGFVVPIIFLDTDFEKNSPEDRALTYTLYGGDDRYRFMQEVLLGIGGVRMLRQLAFNNITRYHMNEGHSSLLTLELLNEFKKDGNTLNVDEVRKKCVFTTHTPVPTGHDKFSYDLVSEVIRDFVPMDFLKSVGGKDCLNMTMLALNLSHFENGVAKEHGRVSQEMFPGYKIESITNGIHPATWASSWLKKVFDKYIPGWRSDPFSLRYALSIPREEIWEAHEEAKKSLIEHVNSLTNASLEPGILTIGYARRATAYKRPLLVFHDVERLVKISNDVGKIQFVFAGNAHPNDLPGKELIKKIFAIARSKKDSLKIAYIPNYEFEIAKRLVSGVDLWLNTPKRPLEASGTSGMKAAMNGVPSLSILDGWWIEGCIEDFTGWSIGSLDDKISSDDKDANSLYEKLEKKIVPMYYGRRHHWMGRMRDAIAINGSFFNTHRMVLQYVLNAYLY